MISIAGDKEVDRVVAALADPTRRRIVELLARGPRPATELHQAFAIAGPAVSRHLRVLREAGLVSNEQVPGDKRVRLYRLEGGTLALLARWLEGLGRGWQGQLDAFQDYVTARSPREDR